jgi:hypothetical protein
MLKEGRTIVVSSCIVHDRRQGSAAGLPLLLNNAGETEQLICAGEMVSFAIRTMQYLYDLLSKFTRVYG